MATILIFRDHSVMNVSNQTAARVWYSVDNHIDGKPCVTIYDKDYGANLAEVFGSECGYENATDMHTDYFEHGRVRLREGHPLYTAARSRALEVAAKKAARRAAKAAKVAS